MSGRKITGEEATVALSPDASGELPAMGELLSGRYELLGLIGVGGMGSVYRARDVELDEVVALKTIARDLLTSPAMLERFRQEVKLARRVTHKNVARMFDIGEHKNLKFLTMELVEGESLGDLLQREAVLGIAQTAAISKQICAGLTAAHEAGVVHRDLKPDNVMLAKNGRVLITDFGIARAMEGSAHRTQGMPVGTPAYMAPEQIEGASDIDARADVYALGVMLYEMLVGSMPFEGDSVYAVAAARLVRPPPNPQEKNPQIPNPVAAMIMKCMQRRKEDRYATAADVVAAFDAVTLPTFPAGADPVLPPSLKATMPATPSHGPVSLTPPTLADADGRKIVAVLNFKNMGSPEDAHLAEGLTEDVVDALSMAKGVRVRSRGATQFQADKIGDTGEIGRALGVQVIVDGTLRRTGDSVRATIRLVSVEDGLQLWAKRFERPVGEILRIGDEAAAAITSALTAEPGKAVETGTNDPVAIDLYLRGRQEYHRVWHDANTNAIELLGRALERAPNDPKIMGAYALALARRYAYEFGAEHAGDQAVQFAEKTLLNSPRSSTARTTLAVVRWNQNRVVE
ncbi:MAG TPA: serine/threonine-protein kinase, partial [Polyangiaceae bacterium]